MDQPAQPALTPMCRSHSAPMLVAAQPACAFISVFRRARLQRHALAMIHLLFTQSRRLCARSWAKRVSVRASVAPPCCSMATDGIRPLEPLLDAGEPQYACTHSTCASADRTCTTALGALMTAVTAVWQLQTCHDFCAGLHTHHASLECAECVLISVMCRRGKGHQGVLPQCSIQDQPCGNQLRENEGQAPAAVCTCTSIDYCMLYAWLLKAVDTTHPTCQTAAVPSSDGTVLMYCLLARCD